MQRHQVVKSQPQVSELSIPHYFYLRGVELFGNSLFVQTLLSRFSVLDVATSNR